MFLFTIHVNNLLRVFQYFSSLEEAKTEISKWPWSVDRDHCSYALYEEIRIIL